jgi:multiple sugar transport system ATP-binding protein
VERIGARAIVHLGEGEATAKAVLDNDVCLSIGEMIVLAPNPKTVRIFDAATGNAIEAR